MNSDRKHSSPNAPSKGGASSGSGLNQPLVETEPTAGHAESPVWLVVLLGVLLFWAQLYIENYAGGFNPQVYEPYRTYAQVEQANPKDEAGELIAKGEVLYTQLCVACHQGNGMGSPGQFPPLAGSEWVIGSPDRLIRIVLHGPTGPFKVKGVDWNPATAMVPFGSAFPPDQVDANIAAILTFIRQSWGNKAPPIKLEDVKRVREETKDRAAPWTMDELLKIPETQ
ncbi:MAG: c-type cytochrome [Verrucomicrobia bacterium]|nr:c-type cytochrome [Verrucomicrobiota bacterium]